MSLSLLQLCALASLQPMCGLDNEAPVAMTSDAGVVRAEYRDPIEHHSLRFVCIGIERA